MLLERINHYPQTIKEPVRKWVANPLRSSFALGRSGKRMNTIGETANIRSAKLPKDKAFWATAMLAPCIFIAAVSRGGETCEIDGAVVGHFSTRFTYRSVSSLLRSLNVRADVSSIFIAGLAEKNSHETLEGTCLELVDEIGDFGIPLRLTWIDDDKPILYDRRTGRIVSDIGFGLNDLERDFSYMRIAGFGVTTTHAVMLSTLFRQGNGLFPQCTNLLAEDVGLLTSAH